MSSATRPASWAWTRATSSARCPARASSPCTWRPSTTPCATPACKVSDIDGVFTAGQHSPATIAEAIGVVPRYVDGTTVGGCSFIIMVGHAMLALHHGLCDVAVISHGESGRSGVGVTPRRDTAHPRPVRDALRLRRRADLLRPDHHPPHARVRHHARAVGAGGRLHAQVGGAQPQGARIASRITVKDVLDSRPVVWPFNMLNICLVTDAGGAVVLTRADRAKRLRQEARLRARRRRGRRARDPHPDAQPHLQRGHAALRREGVRHGRRGPDATSTT